MLLNKLNALFLCKQSTVKGPINRVALAFRVIVQYMPSKGLYRIFTKFPLKKEVTPGGQETNAKDTKSP